MRTFTLLSTLLVLCSWTLPAHAQQKAEDRSNKKGSVVQVTMQSQINNASAALQLPLPLIERLHDQEPLTNLNVETNELETQLSARFSFESMEAFQRWYESPAAQEILRRLNEKQSQTELAVQLTKARPR